MGSTGPSPPAAPAGPPGLLTGPFIDTRAGPLPHKAVLLVAPVTVFYVLSIVAIGLRIWAKQIKKNALRFSDYAIFVAAIFGTAYFAICWLVAERGGVGYPLIKVPLDQRKLTQQSFVTAWLIQAWANTFVRLSILDFFAQIFRVSRFSLVVYVFEALSVVYLVGCTITFFAICRPMRWNWALGPEVLEHCGNLNLKFLLSAIFNLTLDVCILVLPMPMLWRLQLNSRKKFALTFVFGLGIFVVFATAWRTYSVVHFSKPESKLNFTMTVSEDALWSGLEITLGIINACMPVMHPALQKLFGVPLNKLLSLTSTWSSKAKSSKFSSEGSGVSKGSNPFSPGSSWRRIGGGGGSNGSKHGITQEVSIDIEAESANGILMENRGETNWEHESKA